MSMSPADWAWLNQVLDYLIKKGFNQSEAKLRQEMTHFDNSGRRIVDRVEDRGGQKYGIAYRKYYI